MRRSLIAADVELTVARTFVKAVQERQLVQLFIQGQRQVGNMQADPAQHFVHICMRTVNLMDLNTSINYQTPKGGLLTMMVGL